MTKRDFIENMISFLDQYEPQRITRDSTWSDTRVLTWGMTKEGHEHWRSFWIETKESGLGDTMGCLLGVLKSQLLDIIPESDLDKLEEMILGDEGDRKMAVIILRYYYSNYAGSNLPL